MDVAGNRMTKDGHLRISCEVGRTQIQNLREAYAKIDELIEKASELPKGPTEEKQVQVQKYQHRENMHRISNKKFKALKKQNRSI